MGTTGKSRPLNRAEKIRKLQALYREVPDTPCVGLCGRGPSTCCGPISMGETERVLLESRVGPLAERRAGEIPDLAAALQERHGPRAYQLRVISTADGTCPLLDAEGRCSQYDARPMLCRLYGAVPSMSCPYGCMPKGGQLSDPAGGELLKRAMRL